MGGAIDGKWIPLLRKSENWRDTSVFYVDRYTPIYGVAIVKNNDTYIPAWTNRIMFFDRSVYVVYGTSGGGQGSYMASDWGGYGNSPSYLNNVNGVCYIDPYGDGRTNIKWNHYTGDWTTVQYEETAIILGDGTSIYGNIAFIMYDNPLYFSYVQAGGYEYQYIYVYVEKSFGFTMGTAPYTCGYETVPAV